MSKVKLLKVFIIILLLLCIIMLVFTIFTLKNISQEYSVYNEEPKDNLDNNNLDIEIIEKEYKSIEEVFEENNIELLSIKDNIIRITFPKDLYE